MSALGDAGMNKFLDRSSTLLISTKNAKTRLNSGSFSFVYEKCTNYLILLRIETARSSIRLTGRKRYDIITNVIKQLF